MEIPEGSIMTTVRKAWISVGFPHKAPHSELSIVCLRRFFFCTHDDAGNSTVQLCEDGRFQHSGDYLRCYSLYSRVRCWETIVPWGQRHLPFSPGCQRMISIGQRRQHFTVLHGPATTYPGGRHFRATWETSRLVEVNLTRLGLCDGCVYVRV